jgi:hypothetical protein
MLVVSLPVLVLSLVGVQGVVVGPLISSVTQWAWMAS